MEKNILKWYDCRAIDATHSLAEWTKLICRMPQMGTIMTALESMFKRNCLYRNADDESTQITDGEAFLYIYSRLLDLGYCVDEVAHQLLLRGLDEIFEDFVKAVNARGKLDEIGLLQLFLRDEHNLELFNNKQAGQVNDYLEVLQQKVDEIDSQIPDDADTLKDVKASVKVVVERIWE